ncbi:hypothetical protein MRX96_049045 [Rhipicephalus microplus]
MPARSFRKKLSRCQSSYSQTGHLVDCPFWPPLTGRSFRGRPEKACGLTWEEAKRRGRDGVEAACHNGEDSVTVSGPADAVAELVKELRAEELFARVVNTMDVAFHSAQMQRVGPALLKHYKEHYTVIESFFL